MQNAPVQNSTGAPVPEPESAPGTTCVHGRNCVALARRNPVPTLDERIAFAEEGHRYYIDGVDFKGPSVTKLVAQQFAGDKFDSSAVVKKNLSTWRRNASSKYHALIAGKSDTEAAAAVEHAWSETTRLGTLLHYVAECHLNGEEPAAADVAQVALEYAQLQAFLADYPTLEPWRTELSLFHTRPGGSVAVVGQLDALFRCRETGKMLLIDFKRVERRLDPEERDWGRGGVGVLEGLRGNQFVKFSIQLHIYAAMCEHHNIPVDACYILKLHPTAREYELLQACDLAAEAREILAAL